MTLTSKFVGTGPSSYEKRIYRAAVSQRLRNTAIDGMDNALLRESQHHTAVSSPQSLHRQSYPGLRNKQCKMKSPPYHGTHTHTHTRAFRISYDVSPMTLTKNVTVLLKMFPFCKSACKQFRVVTMNCLMSREGGFNKGNLRED